MATAICITIDPAARLLTYSSAGHPPPLLRDDDSGSTRRLDLAQAPPLGFAAPEAVVEGRLALPARATLLAYTDGVIERRDQVIDEGIERLESAFASADPGLAAGELVDKLIHEVAEVTAADDDVALVVMPLPGEAGRAALKGPPRRPGGARLRRTCGQTGPSGRAPRSSGMRIVRWPARPG